jgi:hypothetical protein
MIGCDMSSHPKQNPSDLPSLIQRSPTVKTSLPTLICLAALVVPSILLAADLPETFGASDDAVGPIGGGKGYTKIVAKGDFTVKTMDELVDALAKAKSGQTVYIDDAADLDFTVRVRAQQFVLELPGGVTLASGRGNDGSKGALIRSGEFATTPLIKVNGPKARITGIRLQGPDPEMRWEELPRLLKIGGQELYYKFPTSAGVHCSFADFEVDNCEISGWSHGGVVLQKGGDNAHVHHNDIHHCQRRGLGYGVSIDQAVVLIDHNLFNYCRHSVAATGAPGTAYEAHNNLVQEHGILSSFDMHGGGDRGDGTNIAGDWIKLHHNTLKGIWNEGGCVPGFGIRGVPAKGGEIHHNWFCDPDPTKGNFKDKDPNVKVYRNQYGPKREVKD